MLGSTFCVSGVYMEKKDYLKKPVVHIDFTKINSVEIIRAMRGMSFTARDLAVASEIYDAMLADEDCAVILTIAGSTSAAGCMQLYADLVRYNMVDVIVATGATIVELAAILYAGIALLTGMRRRFRHAHG